MKAYYWIGATVGLVALVYCVMSLLDQPITPERLAVRALSAATTEERQTALVELSMRNVSASLTGLRRVAAESQDPKVTILALNFLINNNDSASVPVLLAALDNSELQVRQSASKGLLKLYGGTLPKNLDFRPDDPAPERLRASSKLREVIDGFKGKTQKELEVASKKDSPTLAPTPSSNPAPTPASVTSPAGTSPIPAVSAESQVQVGTNDYPAIKLLAWMWRVMAVLLLVVELVGAFSLLMGEPKTTGKSKHALAGKTAELSAAEEVERVLAKNSAGAWSKVAILVAGAIGVIALLSAAEMLELAVRVEQKLDYSTRK